MTHDEARLDAALRRLAREEAAAVVAEVMEASRREASDILRRRLTSVLVEEVGQLIGGPTAESRPAHHEVEPAQPQAKPAPVTTGPLAGWYVYGLTWDASARALDIAAGVDDAPVEMVGAGPIAAVVSPMASTESWGVRGDGDVDLDVLAPRARRHEWVLEQMLEHGAVLPLRFGVLYPSLDPLRQTLNDRRSALEEALRSLYEHSEWGLTVSAEKGGEPRPLSLVHSSSSMEGRDYLVRRRADRLAEEERDGETARVVDRLHETLMGLSADARVHPGGPRGTNQGRLVLRASYLVPEAGSGAFRAAAEEQLSAAPPYLRLTGELTGPWPAYHFCDLVLDGVNA